MSRMSGTVGKCAHGRCSQGWRVGKKGKGERGVLQIDLTFSMAI